VFIILSITKNVNNKSFLLADLDPNGSGPATLIANTVAFITVFFIGGRANQGMKNDDMP
jgi:hypothetical protein